MQIESDHKKTAAALLVLVAVFAGLSWYPRAKERTELESRVDEAKKQQALDRKSTKGLNEFRAYVADLRNQSKNLVKVVPTSSDLADLLRQINAELATYDMKKQEVQTEVVITGADFNVIPLKLRFEGRFDGLFGFVKNIESMPRLTRINKLEVAGMPTKPGEPLMVRLELSTFSSAERKDSR